MTGAYAYTPAIWPPLAGVIFLAAIGLYCWRRRSVPAALPLLAVSLFGALFLLGIALEAAAVAPATKIAWFRFQGVWRAPSVTAGLCFVLEYAYPGRWLTRRNLVLLSIPALLDIFLVVINDSQLMWRRLQIGPGGSVVAYLTPAGVILAAYGVGLVLVNAAVLLWLFIRSPQHRWPVALILAGQIANREPVRCRCRPSVLADPPRSSRGRRSSDRYDLCHRTVRLPHLRPAAGRAYRSLRADAGGDGGFRSALAGCQPESCGSKRPGCHCGERPREETRGIGACVRQPERGGLRPRRRNHSR